MRKLIKLAVIALGVRALLRWRARRKEAQTPSPAAEPETDPADELRRKLAESRDDVLDDVAEPEADVAGRRAAVHERGHATLDEMKPSDEG